MFPTMQSIKCTAKMSFLKMFYAFHAKVIYEQYSVTFFYRFSYSCELFLEELGLLGQLQQNMRWRGEIFSCYILI